MRADVLEVKELHVRGAPGRVHQGRDRGHEATREHVALDEVDGVQGVFIHLVLDGYRLQQHQSVVLGQGAEYAEVAFQELMAHGLDHFDGHDLVEAAAQFPVVLLEQRDPLGKPGVCHGGAGVLVLLVRDRRRRHLHAVVAGRVDRQAAPAGADFQQVLAGPEVELAADHVELGQRGLLERRLRRRVDGARVGHGRVEKQREEVVAEVVVGGDVPLRPTARVAIGEMQQFAQWRGHERRAALEAVHHRPVAHHQADEARQVTGAPVAAYIGLRGPHRAAEGRVSPEPAVENLQLDADRARLGDGAEAKGLAAVADHEFALGEVCEASEHHAPADAANPGRSDLAVDAGGLRNGCGVHSAGWVKNGVRLSSSFSACQWIRITTFRVMNG